MLDDIGRKFRLSVARRLTPPEHRVDIEALNAELTNARESSEKYQRITAEMGQQMGELRDQRDNYKLQWETAATELRRPMSRGQLGGEPAAAAVDTHIPSGGAQTGMSPLRILCVGTGRDGTTSLSRTMQDVFDRQESGETAKHEWASSDLNMLFCEWKETNDPSFERQIRDMIAQCPYACGVGNGYAAVLPIFAEIFGERLTLIHLRRRDRAACIASLIENAEVAPHHHAYYSDSPLATRKRPTAFHFSEMSRDQWMALSLPEKFGWYYDKTHSLIEQHKGLFPKNLSVDMEDLSDAGVRSALARAAGSDETPQAFHVNRFVDLRHVPQDRHSFVQRLLGQLNVQKLANDDLYGLRDVLNEFVYHLAHFPDQKPGALDELRWTLTEAYRLLDYRMNDLKEIMERVGITPESEITRPGATKQS